MKTFIQELAATLRTDYADWDSLTVVFPNRRAALYFRKALSDELEAPRWAPTILSIEEFIASFSDMEKAETLPLIVKLYHAFKKVTGSIEGFDHFYFWGEMLLRDFDEIDKYMVDADALFRDLSNQKEIDQHFDYLTKEQKDFLKDFWRTVEFSPEESKGQFLALWRNLPRVYAEFRNALLLDGVAYNGMIHRQVAETMGDDAVPIAADRNFVFAGFNALTTAEEKIICWFVENRHAKVIWDEDEWYVSEKHREAGTFFRQYRNHSVLGKTFSESPPALLGREKRIRVLGVPQKAGQPKLMAQEIEGLIASGEFSAEGTVIVLPDESLLLPVLYALPPSTNEINVTMGFPLASTPYYSLIDFLFDLHLHKRKNEFYYRYVLALLNHPYIKARLGDDGERWRFKILKDNQVYISLSFFEGRYPLLDTIFGETESLQFIPMILQVVESLATTPGKNEKLETEFAFNFHRILSRIQELVNNEPMDLRLQQRLFRQVVRSEKIPFSGEPLRGLQVMGVLETRNLDFKRVIVLSLNEGLWPSAPRQGSYIPHTLRRVYNLPTVDHQDATYSYLFYRLLQRAEHIDLYYNTEPDVLGTGEMSRYIYQLIFETGWPHEKKVLYTPVQVKDNSPITIEKSAEVIEKLERYTGKALTPSTLNTYIECRLKFYFRHLVEIREPEQVEEDADARIFGNIFHKVMELYYSDIRPPAGTWYAKEENFRNIDVKLDRLIEQAFRNHFKLPPEKKFEYEGRQLVVKEMVRKFAHRVLAQDKANAPFEIELLEATNYTTKVHVAQRERMLDIVMGGMIDRVDRVKNTVRILDYKTGKDENKFDSVASLFVRDLRRNKAAFQALLYAWIYERKNPDLAASGVKLLPGLINRREIFNDQFEYGLSLGKDRLDDVQQLLPEFEQHLMTLLRELFDPAQPFDQTEELKTCAFCAFKEICGR